MGQRPGFRSTLMVPSPVTFQDTGSASMALQQNKSVGMVANTMSITNLVNRSKTSGAPLKMIHDPMLLEPVAIGMKKGETKLLEKVNVALMDMDKAREIDIIWNKWRGPNKDFKMVHEEHVQPITAIKITPIRWEDRAASRPPAAATHEELCHDTTRSPAGPARQTRLYRHAGSVGLG